MAVKKKTNYVEAELKKFQGYINQLQSYLDKNPPDDVQDRLDVRYNTITGNPVVKTIASKETQLKAFRDTLDKLPGYIEALNRLRKMSESDTDEESVEKARGNVELPGIFRTRMLEQGKGKKEDDQEPPDELNTGNDGEDDDDDIWEED
jgi:Asp-tRNA(Asn)/Glu-tRNA(Gln) amidotransferase C subunit